MEFAFEKLEVYQKSLRLVGKLDSLALGLKGKVSHSLLDQMGRASLSIPLNIAEGNGRWHAAEKKNFMVIARGSASECVPILQVLKAKNLLGELSASLCDSLYA